MEHPFRAEMVFLDTTFETLAQTGARASRAFKIVDFSAKSAQKVIQKPVPSKFSLIPSQHVRRIWGAPSWFTLFPHAGPGEGKIMLAHLAVTRYALMVRATHHPSRSPFPPAEPSHRIYHCEDISGCEKAAISVHACTSTISFLLSRFLFVF